MEDTQKKTPVQEPQVETPLEQPAQAQEAPVVDPVPGAEPTIITTPNAETATTTPTTILYNCDPCKGQGLIGDPNGVHSICTNCLGTGRVS